jgi:hypothetical protein
VYRLTAPLDVAAPGVVVRGRSGDRDRVVLSGGGMLADHVGVAIAISAPDVTVMDLTAGWVKYHGIQIRGERGASRAVVHNVRLVDTGQQLLKVSVASGPPYADDGLIACSRFEYTDAAPSDYTNGIDVLAGRGWIVRRNHLARIRGPESKRWAAGPAILFWANSRDTIVEHNSIVDSFRGIAFGLGPGASTLARDGERILDHQGGRIAWNVVSNLHGWADEGLEANSAAGVVIEHNTVLTEGDLGWAISLRFPATDADVRRNLTTKPIVFRNRGRGRLEANVDGARPDWFVDPAAGDLRLVASRSAAADAGAFPEGADALPEGAGR